MSFTGELINNYNTIRQRLQHPPHPVFDKGIDLRRKLIPLKLAVIPPTVVLESDAAYFRSCVVHILEIEATPVPRVLTLKTVQRAVCRHFGIGPLALTGVSREKKVTYPRHVFCYLARTLTGSSYPHIGRWLGGRDHTSTLHGYRKIKEQILVDSAAAYDVKTLEVMINGGLYDSKNDLPRSPLATLAKLNLAQEQPISVSESKIYPVDN